MFILQNCLQRTVFIFRRHVLCNLLSLTVIDLLIVEYFGKITVEYLIWWKLLLKQCRSLWRSAHCEECSLWRGPSGCIAVVFWMPIVTHKGGDGIIYVGTVIQFIKIQNFIWPCVKLSPFERRNRHFSRKKNRSPHTQLTTINLGNNFRGRLTWINLA